MTAADQPSYPDPGDFFLDALPEPVLASMEVRDRWFATAGVSSEGEAFFLSDLQRWLAGSTLRVAFLGGDTALHRDIESATRQITDGCGITLDFGFNATTGQYRTWSTGDMDYAADIRVSFDQHGFSSLIGRDSITASIGVADQPMGGRPGQRSLNLGGFPLQRPAKWPGVVRHEFLHACAFFHEHQHPSGGCEMQFRWEDPPGYQPTTDKQGGYIVDAAGLQPGIYTYLAGNPNFWSRAKVDHNLRPGSATGAVVGQFDPASIMLYQFPPLFYRMFPNPCSPTGNGLDLSPGDIAGLLRLYPLESSVASTVNARRTGVVEALSGAAELPEDLRAGIANLTRQQNTSMP
jgi:hypothetical protein